jgi:predicted metal-dependent hydrolase
MNPLLGCNELSLAYDQAIEAFNQNEWYSAHDQFEALWYESDGPIRSLLQGVIQISVAEYHLENSNLNGAILLMAEGLNHLQSGLTIDPGFNLPLLNEVVRLRLTSLQSGTSMEGLPSPYLQRTGLSERPKLDQGNP